MQTDSACGELGLPTGPPRTDWTGQGLRQMPVPGGNHDCFSSAEILRLATRSSLFWNDELHLLGGLASGCPVFETILQAVAETETLEGTYCGLRISLLHHTAVLAVRAARQERGQPPSFGLHLALASQAHLLCKERLRSFLFADQTLIDDIHSLDGRLLEMTAQYRSSRDLEEQWSTLVEDSAPQAIELLWLGQVMGCDAFVAHHLEIAKQRWAGVERPAIAGYALALKSATCGSILDSQILTPFLNLLDRLRGVKKAVKSASLTPQRSLARQG